MFFCIILHNFGAPGKLLFYYFYSTYTAPAPLSIFYTVSLYIEVTPVIHIISRVKWAFTSETVTVVTLMIIETNGASKHLQTYASCYVTLLSHYSCSLVFFSLPDLLYFKMLPVIFLVSRLLWCSCHSWDVPPFTLVDVIPPL